ncbi:MAG: reverse transcriptase family protein [Planctomycetota bacterium]|jgi:retron-type reverse transcriptase
MRWIKRLWHSFRAARGWGLDVDELARRLGMQPYDLRRFRTAYRKTSIPKRSGGRRVLHVPDFKTKALQRRILHQLLARLRSHDAAHGFERGRSIATNARPHVGQAVVIHMDLVDFFGSTEAERIELYFRRVGWNAEAARLLTDLVTHRRCLPQGAPTSPRLSNLVNHGLDAKLSRLATRRWAVYTRYADDITVSFERDSFRRVRGMVQSVTRIARANGYETHKRRKLSIRRRHMRQMVTGLVVNERVRLPRETRRWLRAVRHRLRTKGHATLDRRQIQGWTALEAMVERQGNGTQVV